MSDPAEDSDVSQLPEDLPPVQPPSAGFIIQLFVVPALIVAATVGVWLLFGKLATGEHDWGSLVVELQHTNPHRRWRAAHGLAQMLKADQERGEQGQQLATNRELAGALSQVLSDGLKGGSQSEPELQHQAFLARTLGLFDLPDMVFPPLEEAMQGRHDREVRKNAIGSVAVVTDRMAGGGTATPFAAMAQVLIEVSGDEDPLIRQLCAFTLALFPQPAALEQLEVLLGDADLRTRINAAVGLARHGDPRGTDVFRELLSRAASDVAPGSEVEYEQFVELKNSLAAIERLAEKFSADQRAELIPLVRPIANDYREPKIRISARSALMALEPGER